MNQGEARLKILKLVKSAVRAIPDSDETLALILNDKCEVVPEWTDYEYAIWAKGENIRSILSQFKMLRKDRELLDQFLSIALDRRAQRGRQSFIMLLWQKNCVEYAPRLIQQMDDEGVAGHIIQGLNRMQAGQFVDLVAPFTTYPITWIRNEAKKYVQKYGNKS